MAVTNGDIIRVSLKWFIDGTDEIVNVHTLRVDDVGGVSDDDEFMLDLEEALRTELYAEVAARIANNVVGELMRGINLTKSELLPPTLWSSNGGEGTTDALPRQVTALVALNGNEPRRQGRVNLPPFTEAASLDNGRWHNDVLGDLFDFATVLLDPIAGSEVIVRRVITDVLGGAVLVPTAAVIPASPRTQRRRTPGRGS